MDGGDPDGFSTATGFTDAIPKLDMEVCRIGLGGREPGCGDFGDGFSTASGVGETAPKLTIESCARAGDFVTHITTVDKATSSVGAP